MLDMLLTYSLDMITFTASVSFNAQLYTGLSLYNTTYCMSI